MNRSSAAAEADVAVAQGQLGQAPEGRGLPEWVADLGERPLAAAEHPLGAGRLTARDEHVSELADAAPLAQPVPEAPVQRGRSAVGELSISTASGPSAA